MTERSPNESSEHAAGGSTEPQVISTIVVTEEDVVTALEATLGTGRAAVLRITPPFSGRMRARLHVAGEEGTYEGPEPIHVAPDTLIDPVPAYPTAAETAAELDSAADANTDHHEATHTERLAEWRETVRENRVKTAEIGPPDETGPVNVRWLTHDSE
ncbi:hypothetical protein [Halonotius terrestris]|uniref:hypothetical protein n=1 Tax=Halonotius terrestris TaxID=2487750 RepID=UPI001FE50E45|nr:hypothetical protein [Halonotius terrestris]